MEVPLVLRRLCCNCSPAFRAANSHQTAKSVKNLNSRSRGHVLLFLAVGSGATVVPELRLESRNLVGQPYRKRTGSINRAGFEYGHENANFRIGLVLASILGFGSSENNIY